MLIITYLTNWNFRIYSTFLKIIPFFCFLWRLEYFSLDIDFESIFELVNRYPQLIGHQIHQIGNRSVDPIPMLSSCQDLITCTLCKLFSWSKTNPTIYFLFIYNNIEFKIWKEKFYLKRYKTFHFGIISFATWIIFIIKLDKSYNSLKYMHISKINLKKGFSKWTLFFKTIEWNTFWLQNHLHNLWKIYITSHIMLVWTYFWEGKLENKMNVIKPSVGSFVF